MPRIKQPGRGWAYTGAILGGVASVAANVAHSFLPPPGAPPGWAPEPGAVVSAIVWPVLLFVAVEILARTPWPHGWSWGVLRWAGLLPVAGVAAFVSYRHMSGLLAHYGEEPIVYYTGPLAVDGLMIMATAALMAGRRAARTTAHARAETTTAPVGSQAAAPVAVPNPRTAAASVGPKVAAQPPATTRTEKPPAPAPAPASAISDDTRKPAVPAPARSTTDTPVTASDRPGRRAQLAPGLVARGRSIAEAHRRNTGADIAPGELAVKLRVSTDRARQILATLGNSAPATAANGHRPQATVTG